VCSSDQVFDLSEFELSRFDCILYNNYSDYAGSVAFNVSIPGILYSASLLGIFHYQHQTWVTSSYNVELTFTYFNVPCNDGMLTNSDICDVIFETPFYSGGNCAFLGLTFPLI